MPEETSGFIGFIYAIYNGWISLMSGVLGVILWAVSAAIEAMPVSLRWSFLACGARLKIISR